MAIGYAQERWDKIRTDYSAWWKGDLDRSLVNIELTGVPSALPKHRESMHDNMTLYDFSVLSEVVVGHWEYMLSYRKYIGDSYPMILPNFGSGVNAAFMGAKGTPAGDAVRFKAEKEVAMDELHFRYDPNESWLLRIKDLFQKVFEYFQGSICMGITHLNSGIGPVARFLTAEQ